MKLNIQNISLMPQQVRAASGDPWRGKILIPYIYFR